MSEHVLETVKCYANVKGVVYWLRGSPGVSNLLACLDNTGRKSVVLGHTVNALQHDITKKSHNVLSKCTVLCWATFTAILSRMQPLGRRLDTPVRPVLPVRTIASVFVKSFGSHP